MTNNGSCGGSDSGTNGGTGNWIAVLTPYQRPGNPTNSSPQSHPTFGIRASTTARE